MDQMNKVYWKISDYIQSIKDIKELDPIIKDLTRYSDKDIFQRIKNEIIIEDDWITFTESKIKYVEAAVFENRQFIREEGEVLPIERIRKVSPSSVSHLAKHSDYIEKYTEGEDITPSKLYTVNKDTDYGVYENKFIYLLLLTLSDFIFRIREDVMSSVKGENGVFQIRRRNEILGDDIELSLRLEFRNATLEEKLTEHEAKKLTRMEALRERVGALLATPLMQIVSKEPVISSNITKTNVLTMNENFSNSLELYEYLLNYDKKCYHVNKVTEVVPISSSLAFPMLGLELLVSLLKESKTDDYEIKKNEIIADEKKKAIDELSKRIDKIKEKYQADPSSYVAILEDKINLLESENMQMQVLRDNLDKIVLVKEGLDKDNKALRMDIDNLLSKLRDLEARLKDVNASEDLIRTQYEDKLKEKNKEIEELKEALEKKTNELQEALIQKQNAISKTDKLKEDLSNERKKYDEFKRASDLEIESKDKEINELLDFKRLNEGRFKGIQAMAGEINSLNAETSKEAFDELENEYNAFTSYYEEVWKRTKKEIIKEIKRKKG